MFACPWLAVHPMFPGANSPAYTQAHLGLSEDDMPAHLGFTLMTSFFFDTRQGVAAHRILRIPVRTHH